MPRFSALQRAEIAEIVIFRPPRAGLYWSFSALQRAEIAEIIAGNGCRFSTPGVSVLFNEPKLLKWYASMIASAVAYASFSALQRAEIAEIPECRYVDLQPVRVSVLFNEPKLLKLLVDDGDQKEVCRFSALQRAEIAEISVSVSKGSSSGLSFSALQRAEIAEIAVIRKPERGKHLFQCSSTSRNC